MADSKLGSATFLLKVDAKDFDKKIAQAKSSTTNLGNAMKAVAGSAVMGAMAAGFAALGRSAITAYSELETFNARFTTLLGSRQAAAEFTDEIVNFASKTPLAIQAVSRASTTLLGFGVAAEDVLPTLQRLGDAAQGQGEEFQRLARVYGQVAAAGVAYAEDLNQTIEAGVPIMQAIADQMGVTVGEVKKLASEGKVTAEVYAAALQLMTEETGLFAGAMEEMANTIEGKISTLKDNVNIALASIVDDMAPFIKDLLDFATNAAQAFTNMDASVKTSILFGAGASALVASIGAITAAFIALNAAAGGLPILLGLLVTAGAGVVGAMGGMAVAAKNSIEEWREFKEVISEIEDPLKDVQRSLLETQLAFAIAELDTYSRRLELIGVNASNFSEAMDGANRKVIQRFQELLEETGKLSEALRLLDEQDVDGMFEAVATNARNAADEVDRFNQRLIDAYQTLRRNTLSIGSRDQRCTRRGAGRLPATPTGCVPALRRNTTPGRYGLRRPIPGSVLRVLLVAYRRHWLGGERLPRRQRKTQRRQQRSHPRGSNEQIARCSTMLDSYSRHSESSPPMLTRQQQTPPRTHPAKNKKLSRKQQSNSGRQLRRYSDSNRRRASGWLLSTATKRLPRHGPRIRGHSISSLRGIALAAGLAKVFTISMQQPPPRPFATGGIVTAPTRALIGEAGPEAVVPLDRYDRMTGTGGPTVVVNVENMLGGTEEELANNLRDALRRYDNH